MEFVNDVRKATLFLLCKIVFPASRLILQTRRRKEIDMTFSYYPGCTLKNKAERLDRYARLSAEALGFTLREIPEWQCCGGVYPMAQDEIAPRLSSIRALAYARDEGEELVTLCSACHHVLKRVNNDMLNNEDIRFKANNYLGLDTPYAGETNVIHYLEVLKDRVGFDKLSEKVKKPLAGQKIGAYYGCLLLRPGRELHFDDPENPTILEDFIKALGAEPVVYSRRNECCGGYTVIENEKYAGRQASLISENAEKCGAEMLLTACPLCMYNLTQNAGNIPVYYFTEILAEALGLKEGEA